MLASNVHRSAVVAAGTDVAAHVLRPVRHAGSGHVHAALAPGARPGTPLDRGPLPVRRSSRHPHTHPRPDFFPPKNSETDEGHPA